MSSFVDRKFCLTGQHVERTSDLTPANVYGMRKNHADLEQLETEKEAEEGGIRPPLSLDLGCRSNLRSQRESRTTRQMSQTSDLDLTPSIEVSPWQDPDMAAEDSRWTKDGTKQWTDPLLEGTGFHGTNPSVEADISRNKGSRDGVRGRVGRGEEGRVNDLGSDSDSGKGTVSDCRESPTEEISFPESIIVESCKQSMCPRNLENTSDNRNRTFEIPFASHIDHRKYEKTFDYEDDCIVEVPRLKELQMVRDLKPALHHNSDYSCYPTLPDSPFGVAHHERLPSAEQYLPTGSHGSALGQGTRSVGNKGFPGDVGIRGLIDPNNNNYFEVSSPSRQDIPRCHDAVTSERHGRTVDPSLEINESPSNTRYCESDKDGFDASHDIGSSRRELQAKCQDIYGSRPSIPGSHHAHSRQSSRHDVHDSRHDVHESCYDICSRHEAQDTCQDAYNNYDDIKDGHYDTCDICHDVNDSRYGVGGRCDASNCSQADHCGRGFQAEIQNTDHVMRSSLNGFPTRHESNHANHDSSHGSSPTGIGYSPCHNFTNSLSTVSTEYSFGLAPGDPNSTPGRRYTRREPLGVGAARSSPQKGHRYSRKGVDSSFVTFSESDPEIFHEVIDKGFPEPQRNITPAQYRRIRSVSNDCSPAGPRVSGSTHPALQQPFSDQEAVTLPRPAKPGRSASATLEAEQQANSCGQTEVKGRRLRSTRRWTSQGLCGAGPEMDELEQKTKTAGNHSGPRFRVPSLFKSKKDSSSIAAIGTGSGTIPGNGTPVRSEVKTGNRTRSRSDCETESKARIGSGNAAESGFETGSSLGSVGDISLWSTSLGSTQSVFGTLETTLPVQGVNAGDDHFRRSVSVPNPGGRCRSSASILDRIRAKLIPRKKSNPSKDAVNQSGQMKSNPSKSRRTQTQKLEDIQLTVLPSVVTQYRTDSSSGQIDVVETDHCVESSMTTVSNTTASMTTTFGTSTPTRSRESAIRQVNDADTMASLSPLPASPSSSTSAPGWLEGDHFEMHAGRIKGKTAPPSEECGNAVSEMVNALEGLASFVSCSVTSTASAEKTITEVEFREHRSLMIEAVKEFNQACKQMVIKTPQSELAFLQALSECRRSLDGVADKYSALIDCASLPSDRSKVATPVIAVAASLRETVTAAYHLAGCSARDPAMLRLRRRADDLVGDLGLLMKSVREMNYNRLSRRF